ncbi:DoxX family protein [Solimonas sp. K1W22B-7]|uniref:DoxX family protein n=1 Tax=Solimonas sp. K1W22B-7 TaxID=2303331 RepID=UPI000E336388|nr:DoxX family protein [Solimonas sp. K1W22B-7]AXQ30858.1 DoxX family protein [Solimonas sp. K1W22B-7]
MNNFFDRFRDPLVLLGRLLIATIFVGAGYSKIGGYEATQGYMAAMGVPGALLPLVIFAELGGGLAIVLGFLTRLAALGLAVFSIASAVIFHGGSADQVQQIMFMKNLAMAGGFLFLVAHGGGKYSLDAKLFGKS